MLSPCFFFCEFAEQRPTSSSVTSRKIEQKYTFLEFLEWSDWSDLHTCWKKVQRRRNESLFWPEGKHTFWATNQSPELAFFLPNIFENLCDKNKLVFPESVILLLNLMLICTNSGFSSCMMLQSQFKTLIFSRDFCMVVIATGADAREVEIWAANKTLVCLRVSHSHSCTQWMLTTRGIPSLRWSQHRNLLSHKNLFASQP